MAYLTQTGGVFYLARKTIDTLTLEEREVRVKFYGTSKPSKDQVDKDRKDLAGPAIPKAIEKKKVISFDINARITKKNLESVIGTVWRNRHTYHLAEIIRIEPTPSGEFELIYFGEIYSWEMPMTRVSSGGKWKTTIGEHWYRVDDLLLEEQLEGYRKRMGYCNEQVRETRKEYNEKKREPEGMDGCYAANLQMRKHSWEWDTRDRDQAKKDLEEFLAGMG